MKILDVYHSSASLEKRPVCCARLSPYVAEENEARMQVVREEKWAPNIHRTYLNRKMRRRVKESIPPEQCSAYARYYINDKWYCRKHGALALLDLMAVKEIPK